MKSGEEWVKSEQKLFTTPNALFIGIYKGKVKSEEFLAQGLLTDRYLNGIPADSRMAKEHFLKHSARTPELLEQLKKWNAEAGERDETLAEMALAWILQQKGVTSVLVGASSTAQLEKNMKCVHAKTLNS